MSQELNLLDQNVIQTILSELEKSEDRNRKSEAFDAWQIYSGNQKPYVLSELQRTRKKSWSSYTISDVSVAKLVTTTRAKSYRSQPKRSVSGNQVKTERLDDIYEEADAKRQLGFFDTIINLQKYGLFWVNYRDKEQRYQFMALQGYEFSVVIDKDTGELIGVILNYGNQDITAGANSGDGTDDLISESQADSSAQSKVYAMWSKNDYVVIKVESSKVNTAAGQSIKKSITYVDQPENPKMENKLGVIPFVYLSSETAIDYPTPNPLAKQSVTYNTLMSEAITSANLQGSGISVLSYPEEQEGKFKQLSTGLTETIRLPQSQSPNASPTTFDYRSPNPALDGQMNIYNTYLKQVLAEHGITSSSGISGDNKEFSSGLHMALANADIQAIIEYNQELYVGLEQKIFEIIVAWERFNNSTIFNDNDYLSVIFKRPKLMVTDAETLANIDKMVQMNLIEKWEALVLFDPNLSEEEAKAKLKKIEDGKKINAQGFLDGGQSNEDTESERLRIPTDSTEPEDSGQE